MRIDEKTTENSVAILTTIFGEQLVLQSTDSSYEGQGQAKLFLDM